MAAFHQSMFKFRFHLSIASNYIRLGQEDTAEIRFCDVTVAGQQSLPSGCLASSASLMKRSDARAVFCVVLTRKMSFIYTLILFLCG